MKKKGDELSEEEEIAYLHALLKDRIRKVFYMKFILRHGRKLEYFEIPRFDKIIDYKPGKTNKKSMNLLPSNEDDLS